MEFAREILPGAWWIKLHQFSDARGGFVKTYARSVFEAHGADFDFREEFYSTSARDVIRGMHFQLPPHDHAKLVFCPVGSVLDVLVDLRDGPGQGRVESVLLDAAEPSVLLIPQGIAHGFRSLQEQSLMVYKTSTEHAPSHDKGVRWDSFGFDWGCDAPVVSNRDRAHPALASFLTTRPFPA